MSYPLYTILHVQSNDNVSYGATITQEGVWQIKGVRGPKNTFSTVEEWLSTVPGSPTIDQVTVAFTYVDPSGPSKKKKKAGKWNAPPNTVRHNRAIPYARYIYKMIKECDKKNKTGLLLREDIRTAYNHFVSVLASLSDVYTYEPRISRYTMAPTISMQHLLETTYWNNRPIRSTDKEYTALVEAYRPLDDLYKDIMVPWMEQNTEDTIDARDLQENRRYRDKYIKDLEFLETRYQEQVETIHNKIKTYQTIIDKIENKRIQQ